MINLVSPHGSLYLKPLLLAGDELRVAMKNAEKLPKITLSSREVGDVIMLGIGGFTPLTGFMNKANWHSVCADMTMSNNLFWPIPITLSTSYKQAEKLRINDEIALVNCDSDEIIASMVIDEKYSIDKSYECSQVYATTDASHPGVKTLMLQGDVNIAGDIKVFSQCGFPEQYGELYMTPQQTRDYFIAKGWKTIAAFQTRNPMHRSHEYLAKIAIEVSDGLMIHSLLGKLKPGDIPANVRSSAISELIKNYFVKDTVLQSGYPLDMRYAGPREALLHALFRQNYGCSHLIVGRDHAGVGDYYGLFEAHDIFEKIAKDALKIKVLKMDWTFWCKKCDSMASMKTCPHDFEDRLLLSGTKLRHMLSENLDIPENFSRPEVLAVLREYYAGLKQEEKIKVELSGHSAR